MKGARITGMIFWYKVYFRKLYTLQTEKPEQLKAVKSRVKKPHRNKAATHSFCDAGPIKHSFTTGWMLFPCWILDLRTSAAVQIAKNGPRKPVHKMKTDRNFFLRCSVSWALVEYFPHQDTFKISLLYLKKRSVTEQWSAMKRKAVLCQAGCAVLQMSSPSRAQGGRAAAPALLCQQHPLPQELLPRCRAKTLGGCHWNWNGLAWHWLVFKEKYRK